MRFLYLVPYTYGQARRMLWTWLWNRSNRQNIWLRTRMDRAITRIHMAEKSLGWFCDCCKWDRVVVRYYLSGWRKAVAGRLWGWGVPGRVMCLLGFAMMTHQRRQSVVMDNFGIEAKI